MWRVRAQGHSVVMSGVGINTPRSVNTAEGGLRDRRVHDRAVDGWDSPNDSHRVSLLSG